MQAIVGTTKYYVNQPCCNFMDIIYKLMGMFSVNTKVQTMDDQRFLIHVGHYSCKFTKIGQRKLE